MTPNQLSTLDFENNLVLNALNKDDKTDIVYDFSGGYNVLDKIIGQGAKSRQIVGLDGKFQKPIMGRSQVQAQVLSTVAVGTDLRVNWTDPTYDNFRNTQIVTDTTAAMSKGRVIEHGPGYIIMSPAPGVAAWDVAVHFLAGSEALGMWMAAINRGSSGVESLYEYPVYVENQTGIIRESVQLFRRDMAQTWVKYNGKFWYSAQDELTMQRWARTLEYNALWSEYGTIGTGNSAVNFGMGLKAAIKDPLRGGEYMALTNAMTQENFENWIGRIADRGTSANTEINLLVGRGWLNQLQSFTTPYIQFVGKSNTFGGESVKGLDVREYSINGINAKFVMMPLLNDKEKFPTTSSISGVNPNYTRMQYTAIAIDTTAYPSVGGGMLPAMEKCYFGPQETIYGYIPGLIGQGGNVDSAQSGKVFATNSKDGVTFEVYSDCTYDFMAYKMGWMELAS